MARRFQAPLLGAVRAMANAYHSLRCRRRHVAARVPEIRSALTAAPPGFVFIVGNSHAEGTGIELAMLRPVINGGIGGISAAGYATLVGKLPFRVRAGVAVLFLGSNDIQRKASPLSARAQRRFVAKVERIVAWLRPHADTVLIAAVPPLGPAALEVRNPDAVRAYSLLLRQLAHRHGCRYFDPFADLRDEGEGMTTQAHPDGVHLRDYAPLAVRLAATLPGA